MQPWGSGDSRARGRRRCGAVAAALGASLLAAPAAALPEIWRLVGTEVPPIAWSYGDGRFTRDGSTAHYIREPGGERFDVRFSWSVPAELAAGTPQEVELAADVVAGWDCRPLFLAARVFLAQAPCAFCVDGREVGAGICDEHDEGRRAFRIEPGNFNQSEARLHVQVTDGSLFSATVITYVYARGAAPPTATPPAPPTASPPRTATRTRTRTPTAPAAGEIACGETIHGALSDDDLDIFGDGTFADAYFFTLTRPTTVRFSLYGDGFDPFLWIGDTSNPDDWEPLLQGSSPQAGRLAPGGYVAVANNTFPIAPGVYPYVLDMTCDDEPTPTRTNAPTATRTRTRPPSPTSTRVPTATRTRPPSPTSTRVPTATRTRPPSPTPTRVPTTTPTRVPTTTPTHVPTTTPTHVPTTTPTHVPTTTPTRAPTPTATPSAVVTPTARPNATATIGICVAPPGATGAASSAGIGANTASCPDLVADAVEIVQSVQDLDNSVRLVVGKPTFVRFHVRALGGSARATALLRIRRSLDDPLVRTLKPINPGGYITVVERPDRAQRDAAFLFELPHDFTGFVDGDQIVVEAEVNPGGRVGESDFGNNVASALRSFRYVPPLDVVLYHVGYDGVAAPGAVERFHAGRVRDWLAAAYPVPHVRLHERSLSYRLPGGPRCTPLYRMLRALRLYNALFDPQTPTGAIYYAMVFDRGGQAVRGITPMPSPEELGPRVACGPAGDPRRYRNFTWDTDGSFADWYAGHEIGHAHGLDHPGICSGEEFGPSGPGAHHPFGRLGPPVVGRQAIYGFDARSQAIYPSHWRDVMTYCPRQWISDLTYDGLMDHMRRFLPAAERLITVATDGLLVAGTIDWEAATIEIAPPFALPEALDGADDGGSGELAIVQRDGAGVELARHRFSASPLAYGELIGDSDPTPARSVFAEIVPYLEDAARIDVEGPGVFATVRAGLAAPEVTLQAPNGGEVLSGDRTTVVWTASDADGDPLTANVEYSADDGATWRLLVPGVVGSTAEIAAFDLGPTAAGRFRVSVSDGIHGGSDESDAAFAVPDRLPEVEIIAPTDGAVVASGQTLAFEARVFDPGGGPLPSEEISWRSSRDGPLGHGPRLALSDLSVGRHTVTVDADGGPGGVASAAVAVRVVGDLADLPPACAGDCDGDGAVTVAELVTGVGIALGSQAPERCRPLDTDGDGSVTVAELVAAVNAVLDGCAVAALPTPPPGTGDCCALHAEPGCAVASCQQCVCGAEPECCATSWSELCVAIAQACGTSCECPIATGR